MNKKNYNIIWINLTIFLAYTLIIYLFSGGDEYSFPLLMLFANTISSAMNFIVAIIFLFTREKRKAGLFFINSLIIAIIGFGTCVSIARL